MNTRLREVSIVAAGLLLSLGCASAAEWDRGRPEPDGPRAFAQGARHVGPSPGTRVPALPPGARPYRFRGGPYYLHEGVWYRRGGPGFVVTHPPLGAFIRVLPPVYTTVWFAGVPFYYADGIYYRWDSARRVYIVSEPSEEATAADTSEGSDDLFIYPKDGQSEAQQSTDRYECHRWAADQTGFDPTKAGGDVGDEERSSKRTDYQRAQTACLEARGYSVK